MHPNAKVYQRQKKIIDTLVEVARNKEESTSLFRVPVLPVVLTERSMIASLIRDMPDLKMVLPDIIGIFDSMNITLVFVKNANMQTKTTSEIADMVYGSIPDERPHKAIAQRAKGSQGFQKKKIVNSSWADDMYFDDSGGLWIAVT